MKTSASKGAKIEEGRKASLMTATRKCGMKKRNPITATAPGWPAPKKSKFRTAGYHGEHK